MMRTIREDEEKTGLLDADDTKLWHEEDLGWKSYYPAHPTTTRLQRVLGLVQTCSKSLYHCFSETITPEPTKEKVVPPLSRTAWLDGLRGFAAFMVFWHHHVLWTHCSNEHGEIFEGSFGYNGRYHLAAMHGIRIFFTGGHYAVSVFFVISGYVLTAKPLLLIHQGDFPKLVENLASALFRRWLRLHIPLIATTFIFFTVWHIFGFWVNSQYPFPTYLEELNFWWTQYKYFSYIFGSAINPWLSYNFHSWSIPIEMRGSIVVYTTVLAFVRLNSKWRLGLSLGLMYYFMIVADAWYLAYFVAGMTLSDLDIQALHGELPRWITRFGKFKTVIYWIMLVVAIYLGGVPSHTTKLEFLVKNLGWGWLSKLYPDTMYDFKWYYLFFASSLTVASIQRLPVKAFFETPFCQYLGKISYALYLVHGPLLWTVGDRLYAAVGWSTDKHQLNIPSWVDKWYLPKFGPVGLELSFILPCVLFMLPLTLWTAELVTDYIDTPGVKLAQKFYARATRVPRSSGSIS